MKNCTTRAVASGRAVIQNAGHMLAFCEENLQMLDNEAECRHVLRSFELVPPVDSNVTSDVCIIFKDTRSAHAVKPDKMEPGKRHKKQMSCFCAAFLTNSQGCPNEDFTGPWEEAKVGKKR